MEDSKETDKDGEDEDDTGEGELSEAESEKDGGGATKQTRPSTSTMPIEDQHDEISSALQVCLGWPETRGERLGAIALPPLAVTLPRPGL